MKFINPQALSSALAVLMRYSLRITIIYSIHICMYRIAGKFGEFGESSVIHQTKTIQIFTYNYYLMAESIYSPNFSSPNAHNSEICQTFPLYDINSVCGNVPKGNSRGNKQSQIDAKKESKSLPKCRRVRKQCSSKENSLPRHDTSILLDKNYNHIKV